MSIDQISLPIFLVAESVVNTTNFSLGYNSRYKQGYFAGLQFYGLCQQNAMYCLSGQ